MYQIVMQFNKVAKKSKIWVNWP